VIEVVSQDSVTTSSFGRDVYRRWCRSRILFFKLRAFVRMHGEISFFSSHLLPELSFDWPLVDGCGEAGGLSLIAEGSRLNEACEEDGC